MLAEMLLTIWALDGGCVGAELVDDTRVHGLDLYGWNRFLGLLLAGLLILARAGREGERGKT